MPAGRSKVYGIADGLLIGVFVAAVAAPLGGTLLRRGPAVSLQENRTLAPRPRVALTRAALSQFPPQFEAYFNDRFGFRDQFIHALGLVKLRGLGVSPTSRVIVGKEGWLYGGDIAFVSDYRGTLPLSSAELEAWQAVLEGRANRLAAHGIQYVILIVPDKLQVYPEYLPQWVNRVQPESRMDQLLARLKAQTTVDVIDPREDFRQAKARERIYFRKDTHWNDRGAFLGYRRIMERVATRFARAQPLPRSAFVEVPWERKECDLARMMGPIVSMCERDCLLCPRVPLAAHQAPVPYPVAPQFRHPGIPPEAWEAADPTLPRAVVFHDSFGVFLRPHLIGHFSRSAYFWQDHPFLDWDAVQNERPQVVIQELAEFKLNYPVWDLPDFKEVLVARR
jgi:hypothetical protein